MLLAAVSENPVSRAAGGLSTSFRDAG